MRYTVLIDGDAGAYGVVFPDLPGCSAMAPTIDAALSAAAASVSDWINAVEAKGGTAPPPSTADVLRHDPDVASALAEGAVLASGFVVRATGRPGRANLSLDEGIVSAIIAAARKRGVTRSALVEILAREHLHELA